MQKRTIGNIPDLITDINSEVNIWLAKPSAYLQMTTPRDRNTAKTLITEKRTNTYDNSRNNMQTVEQQRSNFTNETPKDITNSDELT